MGLQKSILHVCERDLIRDLRTRVLRLQGFDVTSAMDFAEAFELYTQQPYKLLLIDVEGNARVPAAEEFCHEVKQQRPEQKVAYICNHRVSLHLDCPDDVIYSDFNPGAMVESVKELLH
jgi:CheY-like chemotaxis protein